MQYQYVRRLQQEWLCALRNAGKSNVRERLYATVGPSKTLDNTSRQHYDWSHD